MTQEQRNAIKRIFPNVTTKNIILLDDQGYRLPPGGKNAAYSLFGFGIKETGSLLARYGLFIHQNEPLFRDEMNRVLPKQLHDYINTLNPSEKNTGFR